MTNPFIRLIELKQQEALLAVELPIAKAEAIAYYNANPVLTGEKKTGAFSKVGDQVLPATLTWKLVKATKPNPAYTALDVRLKEVKTSLETIHAENLAMIDAQIDDLLKQRNLLLVNEETEKIEESLKTTPKTIEGSPREELSVTLPKLNNL
jgi:hypothetical protein